MFSEKFKYYHNRSTTKISLWDPLHVLMHIKGPKCISLLPYLMHISFRVTPQNSPTQKKYQNQQIHGQQSSINPNLQHILMIKMKSKPKPSTGSTKCHCFSFLHCITITRLIYGSSTSWLPVNLISNKKFQLQYNNNQKWQNKNKNKNLTSHSFIPKIQRSKLKELSSFHVVLKYLNIHPLASQIKLLIKLRWWW